MLPKEFLMIPRQKKEGKTYKNDPGVMKQLKIIKRLFEEADEIICATDSAREGEAILGISTIISESRNQSCVCGSTV